VRLSGFIRLSHLNISMPESVQQAVSLQEEKNPMGKDGSDQRSMWRGALFKCHNVAYNVKTNFRHTDVNMTLTYSRRPDASGQILLTRNIQFPIFLSQELMGIRLPPKRDHLKLT